VGITSGQGPPSPKNGSRLSLGTCGVNTKLSARGSFPQTANAFHKRTARYGIGEKHYGNVTERAMSC
jgi:hypothetical protein